MGYTPGPAQAAAHRSRKTLKQVIGGVRAGKSMWTAMEICGYLDVADGLIWLVGPDYDQVQAEFNYVLKALTRFEEITGQRLIADVSTPKQGTWELTTIFGCKLQTKSTHNDMRQLASFAPHLLVMCEAAQQPYGVYEKVVERALEHDAPIILSGTLEGDVHPWYGEAYYRWKGPNLEDAASFSLPSWENLKVFPGGREDPKIRRVESRLTMDAFLERCAAVPRKARGLVHKSFDFAKHLFPVDNVPFDGSRPVELAIDPGYGGAYAIWFLQRIGYKVVNVLDEIYVREMIVDDIIPLVQQHRYYNKITGGVIDIAATQHHAARSQLEVWNAMVPQIQLYYNLVPIHAGIDAMERHLKHDPVLGRPGIMFAPHLSNEIEESGKVALALGTFAEFRLYKWATPQGQNVNEKRRPVDNNNHAIKAGSYYLFHTFGPVPDEARSILQTYHHNYWQ